MNPALTDAPEPDAMWREAVPVCDGRAHYVQELKSQGWVETFGPLSSMQLARCGWGGGLVGAVTYEASYRIFGGGGTFGLNIMGLGAGLILWLLTIIDQVRWKRPEPTIVA